MNQEPLGELTTTQARATINQRNPSLAIAHEAELVEQLQQRDRHGDFKRCVVVEVLRTGERQETILHFGDPYQRQPHIISIPTRISREAAEKLCAQIIPTSEAADMMTFLAECYSMRTPALIEGPTALGKTYLIEKFNELIYGPGIKPLDFYCSGQTDVSELMAKWVPKSANPDDQSRWEEYLKSDRGKKALIEISSDEGTETNREAVLAKLRDLARHEGLASQVQWQLQLGAVPKALLGTFDEKGRFTLREDKPVGCILHIEEVGLARPAVVNALLKLRGKMGSVCDEIELWEDGGRRVITGADFWFVMSTNPPEEYDSREPVDQALARGVAFRRYGDISKDSVKMIARRYFTYQIGESISDQSVKALNIALHPELGLEIADLMGEFHSSCVEQCRGGEASRQQRIPVSFDDMARTARFLLKCQVRAKSGELDIIETIKRAVDRMYLGRLLPSKNEERGINVLQEAGARPSNQAVSLKLRLATLLNQLLVGETSIKSFEQRQAKREEIIKILAKRAHDIEARRRSSGGNGSNDDLQYQRDRIAVEARERVAAVEELLKRRGIKPASDLGNSQVH